MLELTFRGKIGFVTEVWLTRIHLGFILDSFWCQRKIMYFDISFTERIFILKVVVISVISDQSYIWYGLKVYHG